MKRILIVERLVFLTWGTVLGIFLGDASARLWPSTKTIFGTDALAPDTELAICVGILLAGCIFIFCQDDDNYYGHRK